ncbi:chaperonin family protein RbcX [Algibacter sp. L4_22]|uniref:chaperonin family protein RbcX n=1 Tax=Algibacter sp. L4_22 TaxID=2942477 RepID=UPI00201B8648|nr:chaperonin family protein RbcX [Algibacter sp. L4_22]MCL5127305.1 chaperonin family protein RbcX [Algibacter sp. L4_22]
MPAYIIKNEKFKFEVDKASKHDTRLPASSVFNQGSSYFQSYILANFDILIGWYGANDDFETNTFQVIYKDVVLISIIVSQLQNVADYLNKFNSISKEELKELYEQAQLKEKTELELRIEKLRETEKELKENIALFMEVENKGKELGKLLEKLNNVNILP